MSSNRRQTSAIAPLIGFVVFLMLGGGAWFLAPAVIEFVTTQTVEVGIYGQLLPIAFPAGWSTLVRRLVMTGSLFLLTFPIFIIVAFIVMGGGTKRGETDVELLEIRKEKEAERKAREKASKRAARQRRRR